MDELAGQSKILVPKVPAVDKADIWRERQYNYPGRSTRDAGI